MTNLPANIRKFRILATSDVHMNLMSEDVDSAPGTSAPTSLAALSVLMETRRSAAAAEDPPRCCLLFDNGDLLQGTPMADLLADGLLEGAVHPAAQLLNEARYDAFGVGNHDLDYGLAHLAGFARSLRCPVISSNLHPDQAQDWLQSTALLIRDGLRIGVFSILPPSFVDHIDGLRTSPILPAAQNAIAALRDTGCDLIIALAHTGLPGADEPEQDNILAELAEAGGMDVLIGGHSHHVFPSPDWAQHPGADVTDGSLHGVPTVIPGFGASRLGEIDLTCQRQPDGSWRVAHAQARALLPDKTTTEPLALHRKLRRVYARARDVLDDPVADLDAPLHSYFSAVGTCRSLALLAHAQIHAIENLRQGQPEAELPLLSVVSAARAGGRGGPGFFVDIPAGPICPRDFGQIQPYPNKVWASVVTGSDIRDWLERRAAAFTHLTGQPDQPLRDIAMPSFDFELIYGLRYTIDPTRPALRSVRGARLSQSKGRIGDLTHNGRPVEDDQLFLVAGSDYRLGGGGVLPFLTHDKLRLKPDLTIRAALRSYLQSGGRTDQPAPWRFADRAKGTPAHLVTGPGAAAHLAEIAAIIRDDPKIDADGFLSIPIHI